MPQSRIRRSESRRVASLTVFVALVLVCLAAAVLPVQQVDAQPSDDLLITADGVGAAMLGLTPDELAEALGPEFDVGDEVRITVDFDGRVVTRDGQVQFRAAMTGAGEELTLFIVSNPDYATAEGVGARTSIADAEAIYGPATLSWNPDNEGREFVSFENGPEGRIAFRTPGIGGNNVGIYDDDEFETTAYEDDAEIASVWVSCIVGTDCPADRATEPTPTAEPTEEPTEEPTAEPTEEPTEEPTAEPTAEPTEEPTAEPTEEPTPEPTPAGGGEGDGELPTTGATELVLFSLVSLMFVVGGAFVLVERRLGVPAWLAARR